MIVSPEGLRAEAVAQRELFKVDREKKVEAITVTVGGKIFNGDETSQNRMARAIIGLQAAGVSVINWTLANNESTPVSLVELTTALILSGQAQSAVWVL